MILSKTIIILLNGSNIKHFENLGYFIPRNYNEHNKKLMIKKGTTINVKVSDLPKSSNFKVLCKCDNPDCKSEPKLVIYQKLKRPDGKYYCHSCVMKLPEVRENAKQKQTGKKASEETKRKMSKNNWMKKHSGENSPFWNPLLTQQERNRTIPGLCMWKLFVKKRDKYTCQCCNYIGKLNDGIMNAHHINNWNYFSDQWFDISNGLTLCNNCHKLIHKIFGFFTVKKDLDDFILMMNDF